LSLFGGRRYQPPESRQVKRSVHDRHGEHRMGPRADCDHHGDGRKVTEVRREAAIGVVFRAIPTAKPL
jgi:hypothetical protein